MPVLRGGSGRHTDVAWPLHPLSQDTCGVLADKAMFEAWLWVTKA